MNTFDWLRGEMAMSQKNVTLSLDEDTYKEYKKHCKINAIALSKSVEIFMKKQLKDKR